MLPGHWNSDGHIATDQLLWIMPLIIATNIKKHVANRIFFMLHAKRWKTTTSVCSKRKFLVLCHNIQSFVGHDLIGWNDRWPTYYDSRLYSWALRIGWRSERSGSFSDNQNAVRSFFALWTEARHLLISLRVWKCMLSTRFYAYITLTPLCQSQRLDTCLLRHHIVKRATMTYNFTIFLTCHSY